MSKDIGRVLKTADGRYYYFPRFQVASGLASGVITGYLATPDGKIKRGLLGRKTAIVKTFPEFTRLMASGTIQFVY